MAKKAFFQEPSKARIKKRQAVASSGNVPQELLNLREDQYLVIAEPLLKPGFQEEPRKFLKHGPEIPIHRYRSIKLWKLKNRQGRNFSGLLLL